jgi:uncharacterized protein YdeI (YjbR/CyaY-like superfamily)
MKITKSFTPSNLTDRRNWLAKNHDREQEIWLVYFKPASGKTNIDYESSVEEALCFGWIGRSVHLSRSLRRSRSPEVPA